MLFFSQVNGTESVPFMFRDAHVLDQQIPKGLDHRSIFIRRGRGKDRKLVPKEVLPAIYNDQGKMEADEQTVFKSWKYKKKIYGYSVAITVHTTRVGAAEYGSKDGPAPVIGPEKGEPSQDVLDIVNAANQFKVAGHACEPYITGLYPDRKTWHGFTHQYSETELFNGFKQIAEVLFMTMHGINTPADKPASGYKSAFVFIDEQYLEIAHRAFQNAYEQSRFAPGKIYTLAGVYAREESLDAEGAA